MSNGVNFKDICIDLRGKLDRVTAERDALQADLDTKDQRVDELEGLLKEAWSYAQHPQNVVATPSELGKRIDAALNPTPKPNHVHDGGNHQRGAVRTDGYFSQGDGGGAVHTCCGSCPAGCIGAKP